MINIRLKTGTEIRRKVLSRAAHATLVLFSKTGADLTLVLTDDDEIRTLNRDFLGNDQATDVISFPANVSDPETGRRYLGDVIISETRATVQAIAKDHPVDDEIQLLVVHGILHLLGYDHARKDEKAKMWQAQTMILTGLGIRGENIE